MTTTNAAAELEKVKEELAEIRSILKDFNSSDWDGYRNSKGDWNQVFHKNYQNYTVNVLLEKETILMKIQLQLLIIEEKGQLMSIPL